MCICVLGDSAVVKHVLAYSVAVWLIASGTRLVSVEKQFRGRKCLLVGLCNTGIV